MHEVKTEKKSRSVEKQAGFKLHVTSVCSQLCKFVVFSILLRTQTVHLEVSFITYSVLSTSSLFFAVRFVRTFERFAKHSSCFFLSLIFLDILTNPFRVTLTQKGNILGKDPLPVSLLTYYSLKIN